MVKKAKQKENAKRKKAAAKKPVVGKTVVNKPAKKSSEFDKVYKKTEQSSLQKLATYLKKRPVLVVLIVLLFLGASFFAYNQFQIYQEKKDFEQAEVVLDELAAEITAQIGEPLKTEKEKFCSYRSVKTGDPGPPACSVGINLYYPRNTFNESIIEEIESLIESDKNIFNSNLTLLKNFKDGNEYNKHEISSSKMNITGLSLNCYTYISSLILEQKIAKLSLGCSVQDSLSQHFPVKN